jgi:hypothetical protein
MRNLTRRYHGQWIAAALLVVAPSAWSQQPAQPTPPHDAPSPADLEPGVNTSAPPPPDTSVPAPAAARAPAAAPAATPAPKAAAASKASKTDMASKTDTPTGDVRAEAGKKGSGKAEDHLQLDTTQITGNQELPKVLYIVPWKRSDLGDLLGRPANSLLDEVLQPVDRDVFKRENRYYDALKPDASAAADKAGGAAGQTSGDKR